MAQERIYAAIDLKSFYASVECVERHLYPLSTNLVVADASRTEKTICLAVSPSLKAHGISGRARLFEVVERVREVNRQRLQMAIRQHRAARDAQGRFGFSSASFDARALEEDPSLELSYITAPPRMRLYMDTSTRIYNIYLKYLSAEDIVVYSIDEVFLDLTRYLALYRMTARELTMTIVREVLYTTGITATAGIGANLYLAKVAMDIVAKHVPADADGVRIAELDEQAYRRQLWTHEPLTDFWRVGRGYAQKLLSVGLHTMGDIARCSIGKPTEYYNEELLYKLFGVNAELLIDHAWGWEPTTVEQIKAYRPQSSSLSTGQVLACPYDADKARIIVREMAELLVLDLVDKGLLTDQLVLTLGYDRESLSPSRGAAYRGPVVRDPYGRSIPRHAHGSVPLARPTSSGRQIVSAVLALYDRIIDPALLVRRVTIAANRLVAESELLARPAFEQLTLFESGEALDRQRAAEEEALKKEKSLQKAVLRMHRKFGKNAVLKGTSLQEGATTIQRNGQVGGHKA